MATRVLPSLGRKSPGFGHLGVWNYCLGPHSVLPGERLQVFILNEEGKIVRRLKQIEGACIDPGYVDFFESHNCRPALHEWPLVDIDENGKIVEVLHPDHKDPSTFRPILERWALKWGSEKYAL